MTTAVSLAASYLRWRWLAWGAGAGRDAGRAQRRVAVLAVGALAVLPWLALRRGLALGWAADALWLAAAGIVVLLAASTAGSVARDLRTNELFADLGSRRAMVPGLVGALAGGAVGLVCAATLALSGVASAPSAALPALALCAFLVRPRLLSAPRGQRGRPAPWPGTPLRVLASGAFRVPRVGIGIAVVGMGIAADGAARAQGAAGAGAALCALAAVAAGAALADPGRWLVAAWRCDGTGALAKAGRPVAAWLLTVAAAAGAMTGALAAALAAGLGAAFLAWRIAYAGDDVAAWRDGAATAAGLAVAVSLAPPLAALAVGAAAVLALRRAHRRIAPGA